MSYPQISTSTPKRSTVSPDEGGLCLCGSGPVCILQRGRAVGSPFLDPGNLESRKDKRFVLSESSARESCCCCSAIWSACISRVYNPVCELHGFMESNESMTPPGAALQ